MSTSPIVRRATRQEIGPMLDLINSYAARQVMLPRTEFGMDENIRDVVVAPDRGHLVGCGALHFYTPSIGEVRSLAVLLGRKERGISKTILAALDSEARDNDLES